MSYLAGDPLIANTIRAALESKKIDRVIVPTDCSHIAIIAERYGAEIPFLRTSELAEGHVPDLPVFKHALVTIFLDPECRPGLIAHLRPASTLRTFDQFDEATTELQRSTDFDSIRSVTILNQNPFKMWESWWKFPKAPHYF